MLAVPAVAAPVSVQLAGNFGAPISGTSLLDNQNYFLSYSIPDPASPDFVFPMIQISYRVPVYFSVPGLGVSGTHDGGVIFSTTRPGEIDIGGIDGVPTPEAIFLLFSLNSGAVPLWNGDTAAPDILSLNTQVRTDFRLGCFPWDSPGCSQANQFERIPYFGTATLSTEVVPDGSTLHMVLLGLIAIATRAPRLRR